MKISTITFVCFLGIVIFFLLAEHRAHLYGFFPYFLALLCPLMHLLHSHGNHGTHDNNKKGGKGGCQSRSSPFAP